MLSLRVVSALITSRSCDRTNGKRPLLFKHRAQQDGIEFCGALRSRLQRFVGALATIIVRDDEKCAYYEECSEEAVNEFHEPSGHPTRQTDISIARANRSSMNALCRYPHKPQEAACEYPHNICAVTHTA